MNYSRAYGITPTPIPKYCGCFLLVLLLLTLRTPAKADAILDKEFKVAQKALEDDKYTDAITHYNRVLQLLQRSNQPALAEDLAYAYRGRADAHYSAEHWQLAVNDYNKYLELNPKDPEAYSLRGVARKATGDYDGLITDEQKAAQLDPQYQYLVDDAQGTVLRRRGLLALWIIGCLVVAAGAIPFVKAIARVAAAERQGSGKAAS